MEAAQGRGGREVSQPPLALENGAAGTPATSDATALVGGEGGGGMGQGQTEAASS